MSKLEQLQLKKKLSDQQMADNLGIGRSTYIRIKRDSNYSADIGTLISIFEETGLSPWEYLKGDWEKAKKFYK